MESAQGDIPPMRPSRPSRHPARICASPWLEEPTTDARLSASHLLCVGVTGLMTFFGVVAFIRTRPTVRPDGVYNYCGFQATRPRGFHRRAIRDRREPCASRRGRLPTKKLHERGRSWRLDVADVNPALLLELNLSQRREDLTVSRNRRDC
jgi:hypothetical protein